MFPNLSKSKNLLLGSALVAAASAGFLGCQLDPYIITAEEQYTRNFIKDFGLIDPNQDWNLAKEATVSINLGDAVHKSVKIYAKTQDKYYLVADLTDISGRLDVPVDVPKSTTDFMVVTNGRKYYGGLAAPIDCSDMSRGVPGSDYENYDSDEEYVNNNPPEFSAEDGIYSILVQHTKRGNGTTAVYGPKKKDKDEYQYFNTQQMAPIIATEPWNKYFSNNLGTWSVENTNNEIGLLPERGEFNRKKEDIDSWIKAKQNEGKSIVEDFKINTGEDGSFTLFPYYYGTNLEHELGVYLLGDNGEPILKDDEAKDKYTLDNFISFPIFVNRKPGDLQTQPRYDGSIKEVYLDDSGKRAVPGSSDMEWLFYLGEEFDLQQYVRIKREEDNKEVEYTYDEYLTKFEDEYHSRIAYHFWMDEAFEKWEPKPQEYATISRDGKVTPKALTKDHTSKDGSSQNAWATISIATGVGPVDKLTDKDSKQPANRTVQNMVYGKETTIGYKVLSHDEISKIEIEEENLTMGVGEVKELHVTLKNSSGKVLDWETYYGQIDVTKDWDTDICKIYKDYTDHTIKIEAMGDGEAWPRVRDADHPDVVYDNVHVMVCSHSITKEYPGNLEEVISLPDWQNKYFTPSDMYEEDITSQLPGNTIIKYGSQHLPPSAFKNVDETCKIVIELDPKSKIFLAYNWGNEFGQQYDYLADGNNHTSNECVTEQAERIEIPVKNWMISGLTNTGLLIHGKEEYDITVQKVALVRPYKTGEEATYIWKTGGKEKASQDLVDIYKNQVLGIQKCDAVSSICDENHDFSNVTPTVEIMDDAGYNNIHYRVKWTMPTETMAKVQRKRSAPSREGKTEQEIVDHFLKDDGKWLDVQSFWSRYLPDTEEVASYPIDLPMLARSRGYDITLYVKDENGNKKPYVGNLGMYLKMTGSYDIISNEDAEFSKQNKYSKNDGEYVVFSQKKFNRDAEGNFYPQTSALSVKHPLTGRTFLTFEDMLVKRGSEDYKYYEYSSDRDVNDLIFNISNYGGISNDRETITETSETGDPISWLWAVEDLGSTDDFDFNDMVMKITSVTKNKTVKETDKDSEGNESTSSTSTTLLYKKVTFEPLCAGGTLPLYVQYTDKNDKTYTLKPGVFKEDNLNYQDSEFGTAKSISDIEKSGGSADEASEIHSWFGDGTYPSTMMINTSGSGAIKAKTCVLYLKDGFSIGGFGSGSVKGPKGGLTVYVKDDRTQQNYSDITDGDKGWVISTPDPGKVSQMFMIYDANTKWRWPIERTHILNAYPKFKEWVNSPSNNAEWFNGGVKKCTVPRYDLGETE